MLKPTTKKLNHYLSQIVKMILIIFFINAPSIQDSVSADLKLEDLGFKIEETKSDPKLHETLEQRSSMLGTHQWLGLATGAAMAATLLSGKSGAYNDFHLYSGIATGALYGATAGYSLFAPKPKSVKDDNKSTNWHRRLAWVHAPAMLIVMVSGLIAKEQVDKGEKIHGFGKWHKPARTVLWPTFYVSLAIMTFDL